MRAGQCHFILIPLALLASQSVSKLPRAAGSSCSANHFCDGEEASVAETVKGENFQEKRESEENEIEELVLQQYEENISEKRKSKSDEEEELVRKQFEDFPSPEVTFEQVEDEKQRYSFLRI